MYGSYANSSREKRCPMVGGRSKSPVTLVVGADSMVGSALIRALHQAGERVVGTTRRRETVDEARLYLDFAAVEDWSCLWLVSVAVICAAVRDPARCLDDPVGSRQVNVSGTVTLAEKLADSGTFVTLLSTNMVFDGSKPRFREDDPVSPVTEYGKQKADAEHQLGRLGKSLAIVRLTRILGPVYPLFLEWAARLRRGEAIHPFQNLTLAPVPLACVVSVLRLIASSKLPGIWHVSGEQDVSYTEVALLCAHLLGADECLVQPVLASQVGYRERVRPYTTLSSDRLKQVFGLQPPEVMWTLHTAFTNPQALGGV